jgi:hypothetical protein
LADLCVTVLGRWVKGLDVPSLEKLKAVAKELNPL